jgi:hypothetical protein
MISVGDHVSISIKGRVAKKEDGKIVPNEWISFSPGDIGRIVNRRKSNDKWLYKIAIDGGVIELFQTDFMSLMDEDVRIPRAALINTDMRRMVPDEDKNLTDNAEY